MKPSQIKLALNSLLKIQQPAFIWGPPGVGKSDIIGQLANENNLDLIDIRAILLDPIDLRGIPTINNNIVKWCQPEFLPIKGKGILFLDELNAAPRSVQAACYQLILDRKIGEYELPIGWTVMAAGNRESDKAITNRMPSALANRLVHINFEVHIEDWVKWGLENNINPIIISFIRFRSDLLYKFDPQKNLKSFPTPRSWEFVSNILSVNPDPEIEYELISGTIGEGTCVEFIAFSKMYKKLPNPKSIIMDPENTEVPKDISILFAICSSLAKLSTPEYMDRIITFANRLPIEFNVLLIKDCINKNPKNAQSSSYIHWISKNQEVII